MRSHIPIMLALWSSCQTPAPVAEPAAPIQAEPSAPRAAPTCGEPLDDGFVEWRDDHIVSWRFVITPKGHVIELKESTYGTALDPVRQRLAKVRYHEGRETIEVRGFDGGLHKEFDIPTFVQAPDLEPERVELLRSTAVFWWSNRDLLVVQDLLPSEFYVACQMLDTETGKWSPAGACPEGDMVDLADIRRGPGDLVALLSAGEGHPAVNVVHWTPATGPQRPSTLPSFDLYPFGPLTVRFTDDPEVLFLETPCDLRLPRGCMQKVNEDEDYRVFLFRWRSDGVSLQRAELPPGATYEPNSGKWAWPTTRGVAVGDPVGDFECHEVNWD